MIEQQIVTEVFLAKIWGPVLLAFGIGIFTSRSYYIKIYRDVEKDIFALLVFGMLAMIGGVAQIIFHNSWNTFTEGIISFLGWGLLAKGILYIVAPRFVDRIGNYWAKKKLIPIAGTLAFCIGAYLVWFGYFTKVI